MKTADIIKWVAIAGAAYLVFRYLQTQGMLGGAPKEAAALPPGATVVPGAAATPPARPADFAAVTRDALHQFAASHMPPGWDGRLTISEWNWMVSNLTGVEQQRELPGGSESIAVEGYLSLRKTAGISGLEQAFGSYQMPNAWAN